METILKKIWCIEEELSSLKGMLVAEAQSNENVFEVPKVEAPLKSPEEILRNDWMEVLKHKAGAWMSKPLVVLSLFDGIGGIWAALALLNIPFVGYSSEVNHHAVQLLKRRYPTVRHLGDVKSITKDQITEQVDLVVGGFPCQDLSWIGKKIGLHGERSRLFFELLRLLKLLKPTWYLAENVSSMHWVDRDEISKHLNCIPIEVDSQELSASKRKRFYWTNIPHPKVIPRVCDHASTSLQHVLENATAIEEKLGCILGSNPLGSHVQLQQVLHNDGQNLRNITLTELEKAMGFPAGYTDICFRAVSANSLDVNNTGEEDVNKSVITYSRQKLSRKAQKATRWKLLGNSFSVRVIAYLLSPLLDCSIREKIQPPLYLPVNVKEEECFAMDVGEVWALYNTLQRPNWYAIIVKRSGDRFSLIRKGGEKTALHVEVQFLELVREYVSGESDKWSPNRGAGRYQVGKVTDEQMSWMAFSHRVTGFLKVQGGYFIYPHKDEVWALYDRQRRSCPWFVLVIDSKISKSRMEFGTPGKEGFKATCNILQHTTQCDVFRVTDKLVDYYDLLQFSFMVPYYVKNHAGFLKLEFSNKGRKMLSEEHKRKRKTRRGSDTDEENVDTEREVDVDYRRKKCRTLRKAQCIGDSYQDNFV